MQLAKHSKIFIYLALMAPLIVSRDLFFPFITGKAIFFRICVEIAFGIAVIAAIYGEITVKTIKETIKGPVFIAFSIFSLLTIITALTAENPSFAFWSNFERGEGAWQILHYFMFFGLIMLIFRSKESWLRLIAWQTVTGTLVAAYAIAQLVTNKAILRYGAEGAKAFTDWIISPSMGPVSGTLGNPSYLGGYMLFSAIFSIFLVRNERRMWLKYAWIFCGFLQIAMFFIARTRGSFAAAGAGIVIALIVWTLQSKKGALHNALLAISATAIVSATTLLVLTVKGNAIRSIQPRLWTWGSAVSGVIERPILGWGLENFPFIFDRYYNPNHYGIESWFDRAHNAVLEYATSGGLPLAAAYLAIFATLYWGIARKAEDGWKPLFLAFPAIYLVNGLVLFEILPFYLMLCLIAGFLARYADGFETETDRAGNGGGNGRVAGIASVIGLIVIGISLYATAYAPLRKNLLMTEALRTNGKTDDQVFAEYGTALAYPSPVGTQEAAQNLYAFTVGYFEYLANNDLLSKISPEKVEKIMENNRKWHDAIAKESVGLKAEYAYITSLLAVAKITGKTGYLSEAASLAATAEETAPTRPEIVRLRMAIAVLRRDEEEYAKARKKGVTLRPDAKWEPSIAEFKY